MPRRPRFVWNAAAARYIDARGRFLPRATIRAEIDRHIARSTVRVNSLAEQLRSGNLTVNQWAVATRRELKNLHGMSAMSAKGGRSQMAPSDWGRVGQIVKQQYRFLEKFATQVASGKAPLDGRFTNRVALYVKAGRGTYHAVERVEMETRGFDEERNVLTVAEHCLGIGSCVEQSLRGWVPIGALVPLGQRLCMSNDRCRIEYRNSRTGQVAA